MTPGVVGPPSAAGARVPGGWSGTTRVLARDDVFVATSAQLSELGFVGSTVTAKEVNIVHASDPARGEYCRLQVDDTAPDGPGVYAWVSGDQVQYVGKASALRQIVHGARMG